jgi:hypothetical protein
MLQIHVPPFLNIGRLLRSIQIRKGSERNRLAATAAPDFSFLIQYSLIILGDDSLEGDHELIILYDSRIYR